jgi:hypothetical protein
MLTHRAIRNASRLLDEESILASQTPIGQAFRKAFGIEEN